MLLRRIVVLQLVGIWLGLGGTAALAPPAFAQGDYVWNGTAVSHNFNWSNPGNWTESNGSPPIPSGSVDSITLGSLASVTGCMLQAGLSCYQPLTDDITGLGTTQLSIADDAPYLVNGSNPVDASNGLSLGIGGINASPSPQALGGTPQLNLPLTLTQPQTWTIDTGALDYAGPTVTGSGMSLTLNLTNGGTLAIGPGVDIEVGSISTAGAGHLDLRSTSSLDGTDGSTVTEAPGTSLAVVGTHVTVGPLTAGGEIQLSEPAALALGQAGTPSTLTVDGAVTLQSTAVLDAAIATPSAASQLTATGTVDIEGATLALSQTSAGTNPTCNSLTVGDKYNLITAAGITGAFAGVPDGTTVELTPACVGSTQTNYAEIQYSQTAVTATILGAIPLSVSGNGPVLTGTAAVGQTLSVTTGQWNPDPAAYTYQWYDCDSSGQTCTSIVGATASTYTVQASDAGFALAVFVTATNSAGASPPTTSNLTQVVPAPVTPVPAPPVNTAPPAISGSAVAGQTLTATTGTWTGAGDTYSYQWEDCDGQGQSCAAISGATGPTLLLGAGDVGHTVLVAVTAASGGLSGGTASSAPTAVVQAAPQAASGPTPPKVATPPFLTGVIGVGGTLTASPGSWTGTAPITLSYMWERCRHKCERIRGANSSKYTLTHADARDLITVIVTGKNDAGTAQAVAALVGPIRTGVAAPPTAIVRTLDRRLGKLLWPHGRTSSRSAMLRSDGYTFSWKAPFSGHLWIRWQITRDRRTLSIGGVRSKWRRGHGGRVKVKLTRAGRSLLAHGPARIVVYAEFAPGDDAFVGLRSWFRLP